MEERSAILILELGSSKDSNGEEILSGRSQAVTTIWHN